MQILGISHFTNIQGSYFLGHYFFCILDLVSIRCIPNDTLYWRIETSRSKKICVSLTKRVHFKYNIQAAKCSPYRCCPVWRLFAGAAFLISPLTLSEQSIVIHTSFIGIRSFIGILTHIGINNISLPEAIYRIFVLFRRQPGTNFHPNNEALMPCFVSLTTNRPRRFTRLPMTDPKKRSFPRYTLIYS